jgi:predicted amidohydrolase YtcJ/MFS family permease
MSAPDLVVHNARITTMDRAKPEADALAIATGRFSAVGEARDILPAAGPQTRVIDAGGRRVIPGLIDSHTHVIRGGLNYLLELRWDGVWSLADAMALLKEQVARTPPPHWMRIVGGFVEHQFAERRLPTLDEINAVAPDTPVFILHLYDRALLNRAALCACGYTKDTPDPPGGEIQRDAGGEPTGLLLARPNALILYATLAKGPKLPPDQQRLSTRWFMRELNRLGVTSVIDAGGGFQHYPDDYGVIEDLARADELTLRIAYNLFTQNKGREAEDFATWARMVSPSQGDDMYRHNGAGEMLVFSAADFEDFREPRPDLPPTMQDELQRVVRILAANRWPWRLHATYDETIGRALDAFERVASDIPFDGLHWFIDHAETISPRNIERIARLGGVIAVQHRMAYQGEYFVERYGATAAEETPPVARMLEMGVPVGAGTDATRVASYNPWVSLAWLVSGATVGGLRATRPDRRLDRATALRLWTEANTWFSTEDGKKGRIAPGQLADLAVLSEDYFAVPEATIRDLESVLTILGGRVVHAAAEFAPLAPPLPPIAPDWSPVRHYSGYGALLRAEAVGPGTATACCALPCAVHGHAHARALARRVPAADPRDFWGALGCSCWRSEMTAAPAAAAPVASAWAPLRGRVLLVLWLTTIVGNVGTWMRDVASGWMMAVLAPSPLLVALVQAAATLPVFLLSLPARAVADLFDRRRTLIVISLWLGGASAVLGTLALLDALTPAGLLLLTFVAGVGAAMMGPVWQSVVPELVPRAELRGAVALNSLGVNIARAIGPALGGLVLARLGAAATYYADVLTYAVVLAALAWWRRTPPDDRGLPREGLAGAMRAGLRYALASPPLRRVLLRAALFFVFASASWALLPLVARSLPGGGPALYGPCWPRSAPVRSWARYCYRVCAPHSASRGDAGRRRESRCVTVPTHIAVRVAAAHQAPAGAQDRCHAGSGRAAGVHHDACRSGAAEGARPRLPLSAHARHREVYHHRRDGRRREARSRLSRSAATTQHARAGHRRSDRRGQAGEGDSAAAANGECSGGVG